MIKENYMGKKAKQYSAEEKTKIALDAIKGDMTMSQISSKYGVHATQISNWKKQALANMIGGFKAPTKSEAPDQEPLIKSLYEQIGQLTVERDWLKKKSALFNFGG
jgi:transposase